MLAYLPVLAAFLSTTTLCAQNAATANPSDELKGAIMLLTS